MTPTRFVRHDAEGNITEFGTMGADAIEVLQGRGDPLVIGEGDFHTTYVCLKRKRVRLKLDNPARLEGMALVGVPAGSTLKIEDVVPGVPDRSSHEASGRVDLEFDYPGTYRIEVVSVKHRTAVFEVTV